MIWPIFSNLYFSVAFIAFIVFVDILVKFKNAPDLKFYFLLLTFSIGMVGLINALFAIDYVFYVSVFKSLFVFSALNILTTLYFPKYKYRTLGFSLFILGFSILFMLLNNKFISSTPFLDVLLVQSVDSHLNIELKPVLTLIRFFIISTITLHVLYFWYVVYNKSNLNNIYFTKIKQWTWYIMALMVFMLIANIAITFSDNRPFWINCLTVFMLFSVLLFVLKRPAFIDKSAKKVALGHKFNQEVDVEIDEIRFHVCFNEQRYYTNNEASLEDFAGLLNVKTSILSQYVIDKFDLNFNDLINKYRVNYFFDIVQDQAFQNYTIDALAKLAGFNSRQHLNKPFKKFHGGNPSDLLTTSIIPS
jgi:AraC-like DNA-binding protein